MLAENITYLKQTDPELYQSIKEWEKEKEKLFTVEKAKDSHDTLKYVNGDQTLYIHSKYNPIKEAEAIIDQLIKTNEINDDTHLVFYGLGLGYHIDIFAQRFPKVQFSILEPSIEVMDIYLNRKYLKNLPIKKLVSLKCGNKLDDFYDRMIQSNEISLVICELPVYPKIFQFEYLKFLEDFKERIKDQRIALNVNYAYRKRWIINSVNNFKEVLKSPNILMENNDLFKDKVGILVAAGPSLNYEIENLRRIRDEESAYIFTVGSAINTLINNNIYPHAMCTYDPSEINQIVFKKINDLDILSIPMIFGSSVGYETLEQYKGPKYHMITSQDTISDLLLKTEGKEIDKINDAPSIAVVTLELMLKLNFREIILVGQNLAYLNDKNYAEGIEFNDREKNIELHATDLAIKDVNGNDIITTESYLMMKNMMEIIIEQSQTPIYNATVGGANINGTQFRELKELFDNILIKNSVETDVFQKIQRNDIYEKNYMMEQLDRLSVQFKDYKLILGNVQKHLNKLRKVIKMKDAKQINKVHVEMNQWVQKMENNLFFITLALPLNRVEYGLLVNTAISIKNEKNNIIKAKSILEPTESFANLLYCDKDLNEQIMVVLKNVVDNFVNQRE